MAKAPYEDDEDVSRRNVRKHILQTVDTQIRMGTPPEAREAFDRLVRSGVSKKDARLHIAQALLVEIWDTLRNHKPYNEERYKRNLKNLPDEPEE